MSSEWIYIDASGCVDARSWPRGALSEASAHVIQRLLAARPGEAVAATVIHDVPHAGCMRISFSVGNYWCGKLLLVPDWVAQELTWPRQQTAV